MASSTHDESITRSKSADPVRSTHRQQRTGENVQNEARSLLSAVRRYHPSPSRFNKLYRCPPTPPPEVQYNRERNFVIDSRAVSHISNDYSPANPKMGSVIPPYNAQLDSSVDDYFRFFGVRKTLEKTGQSAVHESIAGKVHDRFFTAGHGYRYLSLRNKFGSGHSIEEIRGHELFLSDPTPVTNYNGRFGYRRNTPSLRHQPTIGSKTLDANEAIPLGRYSTIGCGHPYAFHCRCKFDRPCRCNNQAKLCPCFKA